MEGSYNFAMVRIMAKDLVDKIGQDVLYTDQNRTYPTAPSNFLLNRINHVGEYIKGYLCKTTSTKEVYVINDLGVGENILGMYVHHQNSCYIKINGNLNVCWNRFALLKELCSLYVDHYDTTSKMLKFDNYLDSIKNAFDQKDNLISNPNLDKGDLDSETFSILLATELMIPIHKREITKDLISKIGSGGITMNDIAKSLLIPEYILKLYSNKKLLDAHPQYDDLG